MRLRLERVSSDADSTIGHLFVDGRFICATVEDEFRRDKVAKETRIPAGTYRIKLRAIGGFHMRYQEFYDKVLGPGWHKGMLWLQDVPNFQYILIHKGNTDDDTEGCIIVGLTANVNPQGGGTVINSRPAYELLYPMVRDALLRGETVDIDVVDRDLS